jgi:NAD(P)-dependent dehydrogenase (short-subunit alcohol dehydrogenase family)
VAEIRRLRDDGETVLFVAATAGRAERTIELLKEYDVFAVPVERAEDARYAAVLVAVGGLSRGFRLPDAGLQLFAETDVSSESQVKALVQVALEKFGRIDILVNNAAVLMSYGQIRAHEMSNEEWSRTMDVNLRGYWLCSKYVIPSMLEKKSGSILFIASRTGLRGFPGFAAYSASKGGVLALMRSMAADYAPDGIRINAIIPGTLDTPMNAKEFSEPGARDKYTSRIPARRLGLAWDIAGMATFLATDEASFCIGGLYFVDGGADLG